MGENGVLRVSLGPARVEFDHLENGGSVTLPIVATVKRLDEIYKGLDEAGRKDQWHYLNAVVAHVLEVTGVEITLDDATGINNELIRLYQKKSSGSSLLPPPTPKSPDSTASTPSP